MQRVIIRTLSFSPLPSVWGPQELGQCHSPSEGQTELEMEAVPASRTPRTCYTQAPQPTYISSLSWQTSSFPPPHTPSSFHPQSWTHSSVRSFVCSFVHSFNKLFLCPYHVPGPILGAGVRTEQNKAAALVELTSQWGRQK